MKIRCQVLEQAGADELEVDEEFRLWPCPYVNSENTRRQGIWQVNAPELGGVDNFLSKFPKTWNSLKHHSWKEILEHPVYAVHFNEEHWNDPEQCSSVCKRECTTGKSFIDAKPKMYRGDLRFNWLSKHQYGNKLAGKKADGSALASLRVRETSGTYGKEKLKGWSDVTTIDFGITTHCNAACSGCNRTDNATRTAQAWLKLKHLNADNLIEYINSAVEYFPNLRNIKFCGERGDPMMHPKIEFLIDTLCDTVCKDNQHSLKNLNLKINTNGSLRNPDFYKRISRHKNIVLTWSIDGFEETNHLYRHGIDFDNIWNNFTAFCKEGGGHNANWDFIVFKHNWHEIPRAKEMAKKLDINSIDFKLVRQGVHRGMGGQALVESIDDNDVEKVKKLINEDTLPNT